MKIGPEFPTDQGAADVLERRRGRIFTDSVPELRDRVLDAEARARSAEIQVRRLSEELRQAKEAVEESYRRADDHPNTSWGALYAERDLWRARYRYVGFALLFGVVGHVESLMQDVAQVLRWKHRALTAERLLAELKKKCAEVGL